MDLFDNLMLGLSTALELNNLGLCLLVQLDTRETFDVLR